MSKVVPNPYAKINKFGRYFDGEKVDFTDILTADEAESLLKALDRVKRIGEVLPSC